jgi:hypothetical protein
MHRSVALKMLASLAVTAVTAAPALAGNNGFETGELSDWTVNTPFSGVTDAYGFTPISGQYFAYIDSGLGMDVYSTLSQTFGVNRGDTIHGFAGFRTSDYLPFDDDGYLAINGTKLLTWSVASVGDHGISGWTPFSFTAPTDGNYTVELGVRNRGDNSFPSTAVLDGVYFAIAPEPASWAMMLGGFGLVGGLLRTRSRKPRLA